MHNQRFHINVRLSMVEVIYCAGSGLASMRHKLTGTEVTAKTVDEEGKPINYQQVYDTLMARLLYALEEDWVCRIKRENPDCHMTHTVIPGM